MGPFTHLQDSHLLKDVKVQPFLLAVLNNLLSVLWCKAYAHFLTVFFIPSAEHITLSRLGLLIVLP